MGIYFSVVASTIIGSDGCLTVVEKLFKLTRVVRRLERVRERRRRRRGTRTICTAGDTRVDFICRLTAGGNRAAKLRNNSPEFPDFPHTRRRVLRGKCHVCFRSFAWKGFVNHEPNKKVPMNYLGTLFENKQKRYRFPRRYQISRLFYFRLLSVY